MVSAGELTSNMLRVLVDVSRGCVEREAGEDQWWAHYPEESHAIDGRTMTALFKRGLIDSRELNAGRDFRALPTREGTWMLDRHRTRVAKIEADLKAAEEARPDRPFEPVLIRVDIGRRKVAMCRLCHGIAERMPRCPGCKGDGRDRWAGKYTYRSTMPVAVGDLVLLPPSSTATIDPRPIEGTVQNIGSEFEGPVKDVVMVVGPLTEIGPMAPLDTADATH